MQKELRFHGRVTRKIEVWSPLYLPKDYQTVGGKRWPLLCFLHGADERGADILLANQAKSRALRSLAVWAFHGAKHTVAPPAESKVMVAALEKAGCHDVTLTLYPHTGHDAHTEPTIIRSFTSGSSATGGGDLERRVLRAFAW